MKYLLSILFITGVIIGTPRVTIITSLYNGDEFLPQFMENMVAQSIFDQAEWIIINAHSPGHEELLIKKYVQAYPNIRYIRLSYDPGIYAVWNMAIKLASAPLIANANVDDRRTVNSLEKQVKFLEENPTIDIVYGDYAYTDTPNDTWYNLSSYEHTNFPEFKPCHLRWAIVGPLPVWRTSSHEKYGYFKEDFKASSDHEMWCRMADAGSQFMKINCIAGLYFRNPAGISSDTSEAKKALRMEEDVWIYQKYKHLWEDACE